MEHHFNMNAILTLNAGSSSLKFSLYSASTEPEIILSGVVDGIGAGALLVILRGEKKTKSKIEVNNAKEAIDAVLVGIRGDLTDLNIVAVGHRIVHGGTEFTSPMLLNDKNMSALDDLAVLAPLHQPFNLAGVRLSQQAFPDAIQVGCFDTAFHRGHAWIDDTFALPRKYYDAGIRRYGFHGLSYQFVTEEMARKYPKLQNGRTIIAHLGNGASMCAVQNGKSLASTMGFSALDGLPMGTRSGQIDPGVLIHLIGQEGMSAEEITHLLYHESGMLGLSGISGDMRTLISSDAPEAAEALNYYVYRAQREIGSLTACLGGLDTLVFCGGVGENAAILRERIANGLGYLGLAIDPGKNAANASEIGSGETTVLTIPTDEEIVIARAACEAFSSL